MLRTTLAVLAGVVAFVVLVSLMDMFSLVFHPLPPGADQHDPVAMTAHVATAPVVSMLIVVLGWLLGTFLGSLVICLIDKQRPMVGVAILAALAEAAVIMNSMMLPHPLWMTVSGIVLIPVLAYFARRITF